MNNFNDFMYTAIHDVRKGVESAPRGLRQIEILGARYELKNPRCRILRSKPRSTNMWYALGEFFWYMSKTNKLDFIEYYAPSIAKFSDDGETLNSAYGYLIFEKFNDQFERVCDILKKDPDSRQAIIMLREPADLFKDTKDQVCTCSLQFFIRNKNLFLVVYMRSNDLMVGTLFDVFCFTMLQEYMAIKLNCGLGSYIHTAGSLHIYESWYETAQKILDHGTFLWAPEMPIMPQNTPDKWKAIHYFEAAFRTCEDIRLFESAINDLKQSDSMPRYWKDILFFLAIKKAKIMEEPLLVDDLQKQILADYLKI